MGTCTTDDSDEMNTKLSDYQCQKQDAFGHISKQIILYYIIGQNPHGEFGCDTYTCDSKELSTLTLHPKLDCHTTHILCGRSFNIYYNSIKNKYYMCGVSMSISQSQKRKWYEFPSTPRGVCRIFTNLAASCIFWKTGDSRILDINGCEIPVLESKNVIDIKCGYGFNIALCQTCDLIISYWSILDQIAIPQDIFPIFRLYHGSNSEVYIFNSTDTNFVDLNVCIKRNKINKWKPLSLFVSKYIIQIGCGKQHCLFLESNGSVWSMGENYDGQLGVDDRCLKRPQQIESLVENDIVIRDIKCGMYHNLVLDNEQRVFSWGRNYNGQCGVGHWKNVCKPEMVNSLQKHNVKNIHAGANHSYCNTDHNLHYFWGGNRYNQCIVSHSQDLNKPILVNNFMSNEIITAYLGHYSTIVAVSGPMLMLYKTKLFMAQ